MACAVSFVGRTVTVFLLVCQFGLSTNINVSLIGYADETGTHKHNLKISNLRTESIKKQLIKLGVGDKRITTIAKGGLEYLNPKCHGFCQDNRAVVLEFKTLHIVKSLIDLENFMIRKN